MAPPPEDEEELVEEPDGVVVKVGEVVEDRSEGSSDGGNLNGTMSIRTESRDIFGRLTSSWPESGEEQEEPQRSLQPTEREWTQLIRGRA